MRSGDAYWRLASGIEVDFVVDDLSLAIEAKSSRVITDGHLKGLRQLAVDQTVKNGEQSSGSNRNGE